MSIQFIQFLRPNGRRKPVLVDRPEEVESLAEELESQGYQFEIEVLTTGQIHMTVSDPVEGLDHVSRVCENGPPVPQSVDSLIREAHQLLLGGTE